MYLLNFIVFLLLAFNFGSFIWAALRFFRFEASEGIPPLTKGLAYLILPCKACLLTTVWLTDISLLTFGASLLMLLGSAALFWRTLRIHGKRALTAAYASDQPEHLVQQGPYRWIRHPFYTAYLLSYLGGWTAVPFWWALPAVIIPYAIYHHASRFEEGKFARSDLQDQYAAYRKRAGRFLPRLI